MTDLDISIIKLFNQYYPNIDHTVLDKNILVTLIENMFEFEKSKYSDLDTDTDSDQESETDNVISDPIIDENYNIANQIIPEMIESGDMISIKGRLNQVPVNILFDSGCQTSTTFRSVIKKANLESIIDKTARTYCNGINGVTKTFGMIWCTELELELETNINTNTNTKNKSKGKAKTKAKTSITVPIKLSILDDNKNKRKLEADYENEDNDEENKKTDILIGTDFMKASNVIINFSKKIITLNDIDISY